MSGSEQRQWLFSAVVFAALGCASGKASEPIAEFPGREALNEIASTPAPPAKLDAGAVPAEGWTVEAPASPAPGGATGPSLWSTHAPWQPRGAWERAVVEGIRAAGRKPRLTEAMGCVARELGRWALEQEKPAAAGLERFILAACGALAPHVALRSLAAAVPAEVPEEEILARWRTQLRKELVAELPAAATDAGAAFLRREGRVIAVLAWAQLRAEIEPVSVVPDENDQVTVAGTILDEVEHVGGYVNQGAHGVAPCFVDPSVPRPRFRVSCLVRGDDETAWVELVYAQPRRVLAHTFVRVLARRPEARQMRYQPARSAGGQSVSGADEFVQGAATALNQVRKRAGLAPVRLHAAQSAAATRVARHYFGAALGSGPGEQMDTIALGLLAGWEVAGMIRDGSFVSTMVPQTRDPVAWLDDTLELPVGRSALLTEGIEEIALGPAMLDDPPGVGALVIGYRFHHSPDHSADVRRLLMRALLARQQRKLEAPKRLPGLDEIMRVQLERVRLGQANPLEALERVLEQSAHKYTFNMRGYVVEATSLDALQIPEGIIGQPALHLEIGVTHHKPPGAAWAQLVILVVFLDYGNAVPT